jgi:uncharacterized protein YgiM (DUF1202 family)
MPTAIARARAYLCIIVVALALPCAADAQQRGGQGQPAAAKAPPPTGERVRVKVGHANVHMGPTTVNEVIVLAPKGTVLPVLARRGEWVQVGISPALRKTGMVMRWYKNEDNGWIHDSLLEIVQPAQP